MDLSNLLNGVQAPTEQDRGEKKALPQGWYDVTIKKIDPKTNQNTGNKGLSFHLRVFGEKYNGYVLFDYMALTGSEGALKFSLPKLKKLGELNASENTQQWVGKRVSVNVSVDKQDETRNVIWRYGAYVGDNSAPAMNVSTNNAYTASEIPF